MFVYFYKYFVYENISKLIVFILYQECLYIFLYKFSQRLTYLTLKNKIFFLDRWSARQYSRTTHCGKSTHNAETIVVSIDINYSVT